MRKDFEKMTDSEIRLNIKSMTDDYEATKNKLAELIYHMKELDEEYVKANNILTNRSKGKIINGSTTLENRQSSRS